MKKLAAMFIAFTVLCSFSACSNNTNNGETSSAALENEASNAASAEDTNPQSSSSQLSGAGSESPQTDVKSLVVYFSWSGNTEHVAQAIQTQTGSDLFEIIPKEPYSNDYDIVVDIAQEEQKNNARPEISEHNIDIAQYDVIYVGFPNWWGDMPMILYTFFDSYDLSGKTIAPFCTSGGSGLSDTVNTIKSIEPNATVTDGLHIGSGSSSNPDRAVSTWLFEIGLAE